MIGNRCMPTDASTVGGRCGTSRRPSTGWMSPTRNLRGTPTTTDCVRPAPPAVFRGTPHRASPDNNGLRSAFAARSLWSYPSQGSARQQADGTDAA
jgi:hypothetical protein